MPTFDKAADPFISTSVFKFLLCITGTIVPDSVTEFVFEGIFLAEG